LGNGKRSPNFSDKTSDKTNNKSCLRNYTDLSEKIEPFETSCHAGKQDYQKPGFSLAHQIHKHIQARLFAITAQRHRTKPNTPTGLTQGTGKRESVIGSNSHEQVPNPQAFPGIFAEVVSNFQEKFQIPRFRKQILKKALPHNRTLYPLQLEQLNQIEIITLANSNLGYKNFQAPKL
jgi:hypothetical protein